MAADEAFAQTLAEALRYSLFFLRSCLVLAILVSAAGGIVLGRGGFLGAFLGSALVLANAGLLHRAVQGSRQGLLSRSLLFMGLKFYLAFAVTAGCCFLVLKFQIGSPFAFLGGLLVFFAALLATIFYAAADFFLRSQAEAPVSASAAPASASPDSQTLAAAAAGPSELPPASASPSSASSPNPPESTSAPAAAEIQPVPASAETQPAPASAETQPSPAGNPPDGSSSISRPE
ncbi:MAG: hypothetical protein LBK52_01075 [Deltaproteobacteria bacterium]|jgi:hypothetical protein|nr:hypothetical protein [Deltaproteobacteria bacterium]